jgi:hypothetical protein
MVVKLSAIEVHVCKPDKPGMYYVSQSSNVTRTAKYSIKLSFFDKILAPG